MYPQQNTQNSTYPLYPPPPPNNNFPPNYLVPTGPPNPMVVAQPSQIKNYANEMVNKIKENQEKMNMENELKQLKEKLNDEKFKRLETQNEHLKDLIKEKNNGPQNININNSPNINTNITGAQAVANATATNIGVGVIAVDSRGRLEYSTGYFCLFLCLNIFLPGIGTIVAGAMFGKATATHADRTGELICHGVVQLLTFGFIFGWIWAIMEASRYFEIGVCC